jgi:hypothetical protein
VRLRAGPARRHPGLEPRRDPEVSPAFRELWPRHEVLDAQLGTKQIEHPELGPLVLHHLQSIPTSHPDLRLTQFVPGDAWTRAALGG